MYQFLYVRTLQFRNKYIIFSFFKSEKVIPLFYNLEFNQYLVYVHNTIAHLFISSFPLSGIQNQYRLRGNNCGEERNDDEGSYSSASGSFDDIINTPKAKW